MTTTRRTTRASKRKEPSDAPAEESPTPARKPKTKQRRCDAAALAPATSRAAAAGDATQPTWVHSLFSSEQRTQWDAFLRTACLTRVGADFYDLFELAYSLDSACPLDAFAELLNVQLCGFFALLDRSVRGDKDLALDKPLCVHGRYFFDPPEVTALLRDVQPHSSNGAHWSYFRDTPAQPPAWVVQTDDSTVCALHVVGTSLFHVLDAKLAERSSNSSAHKALAAQVAQYLRFRKLARMTPAAASRKRASEATAPSLHGLGIVVPFNATKETGYRELPVRGEELRALLVRAVAATAGSDANARKALSDLLTRATIANDECDFGTSLLLGLDVFTAGAALEKEASQLLRVAYMLLRRTDFGKILAVHVAHRRADDVGGALSSIVAAASCEAASHVAESGSRSKIAAVQLP